MHFVLNWKTTALGVASLVTVAANCYVHGTLPNIQDISTVLAAFGLIAAADAAPAVKG